MVVAQRSADFLCAAACAASFAGIPSCERDMIVPGKAGKQAVSCLPVPGQVDWSASGWFYSSVRKRPKDQAAGVSRQRPCYAGPVDAVMKCAPVATGDFLFERFRRINGLLVSKSAIDASRSWIDAGCMQMHDGIAEYHLSTAAQQPAGRGALLVHGWEGCAGQLAAPARALSEEGCSPVVLFDFGAHGNAGGQPLQDLPRMLLEFLGVVQRNFPSMHVPVLVAHSAGVTVVKKALHLGKLTVDRLILYSLPHESIEASARFVITETLGLGESTLNAFQDAFQRAFPTRFGEFDCLEIGSIPSAATARHILCLHARGDRASPESGSVARWAQEQPSHLTLRVLPQTGHVRILSDDRALTALCSFVRGEPVMEETEDVATLPDLQC